MNNPLVTIAIPVYNGSNFLKDAIESALDQNYEPMEILVINDGSTDNGETKKVAESFGTKIKYIEKENGGVSSALNLAIRQMKGKYFCWLSHDDVFLPFKTSDQVKFAESTKAVLVYSDYRFIDETGCEIRSKTNIAKIAHENIFLQLLKYYPINGCTTLIHKSVFQKVGVFNEHLETTQDYDFWFRCSQQLKFDFFNSVVLKSRIHPNQDSVTKPWRQYECDELYTRIGRAAISQDVKKLLSDNELFECFKALVLRGYLSAAFMTIRGIQKKSSKLRAYFFFAKHYSKVVLSRAMS